MPRRLLLLGPPGTGKTTRLLREMEARLQAGVPPSRIAFVSFTRAAIKDAKDRACERFGLTYDDLPLMRTLHSLAYYQLGLRRGDVFGREALAELSELTGEELTGKLELDAPTLGERGDALLFLDQYSRSLMIPLEEAWHAHGSPIDWFRLKRFVDVYANLRRSSGLFDFTDMIERAAAQGAPVAADLVLVDEAQDLTVVQWQMVERVFADVPEMIVCGDDDQCQPAGTMVRTISGDKPIESLDPTTDRLTVYDRGSGVMAGRSRVGFSFRKSERLYTGRLYTVESAGKSTKCTDNHLWLARWSEGVKSRDLYIVYLMRKGDRFRIGRSKMFLGRSCFRVTMRANRELADAVWILRVFETKREATVYETVCSLRYGVPQTLFVATQEPANVNSADSIEDIFSQIDSLAAGKRVLEAHGLLLDHPFINKRQENYSRFGATLFKVPACNMISGMMEVPEYNGGLLPTWNLAFVRSESVTDLPVYGLGVDKHHTYVADGLVTHNCVYQWAGASSDALLDFHGEREVLSQSYRLPRAVWQVADGVARGISRRYDKAFAPADRDGAVEWFARPDEADLFTLGAWTGQDYDESRSGTWLLLARTRRQLGELAAIARDQGVVYTMGGRSSVDPAHVDEIRDYERFRGGQEDLPLWHDALTSIPVETREYYLSCLRRDRRALSDPPRVRVDTVHGAKGLEADRVLLLTDLNARIRRGAELDPDSEQRVLYVGVTRAREALHPVESRGLGRGYAL